MALICDNTNTNLIIKAVKNYYADIFSVELTDVNIYSTDNIIQDKDFFIDASNLPEYKGGRGLFIEKNKKCNSHTILISDKLFHSGSAPSTIIHELTHIVDYRAFIEEYNNSSWYDFRKHYLFYPFFYWAEFHATFNAVIYFRHFMSLIMDDYEFNTDDIAYELLIHQLPEWSKNINELVADNQQTLVDFFYFMGKYRAVDYYNNLNSNEYFPNILIENNMHQIYKLLIKMDTYINASNKFNVLAAIMDSVL